MIEKKNSFITNYLIAINVLIFLLMIAIDPTISTKTLVKFGSKVNFLIIEGQFYRLFTPIFIHLSFYHIGFNSLALYILGRDIEVIFGKKRFIYLYLMSGIISSLASFLLNNSISAGASGAIFGLLGAHIFLFFSYKEIYKRIYGYSFLVLIGINIFYGIVQPNIDNIGHIGGLVGGVLIAFLLDIKQKKVDLKRTFTLIVFIPIIVSSILVTGIQYKKNKPTYFLYKGVHLYRMEEKDKALKTLQEGKQKYPSIADFDYIINNIVELE